MAGSCRNGDIGISIHALLAESDTEVGIPNTNTSKISIHALLAESDQLGTVGTLSDLVFLSTLSLRRATPGINFIIFDCEISIHALLAESDQVCTFVRNRLGISIHALLAESNPRHGIVITSLHHFYPRSPCGERPWYSGSADEQEPLFLSTLSLRRATSLLTGLLVAL